MYQGDRSFCISKNGCHLEGRTKITQLKQKFLQKLGSKQNVKKKKNMREKLRINNIKPRAQMTNYYEFHKEHRREVWG